VGAKLERKGIYKIQAIEALMKDIVLANLDIKKKSKGLAPVTVDIDGNLIFALSDRYKLFFTKGYACCECGLAGQYFALEHSRNNKNERCHLNLYSLDSEGNEILLTKDHIIPKSENGKNNLSNYQVMCEPCNSKKGNTLQEEI
jgi:hypothetical protein